VNEHVLAETFECQLHLAHFSFPLQQSTAFATEQAAGTATVFTGWPAYPNHLGAAMKLKMNSLPPLSHSVSALERVRQMRTEMERLAN
jgi:hypothetical protein